MHPSHIAIRNPVFVFVMVLVISIAGFQAYKSIPREAAPDIQIPLLIVSVPFPGATPEDVESLITNKVEQELKTIKNLEEILFEIFTIGLIKSNKYFLSLILDLLPFFSIDNLNSSSD